MRLKQFRMGIKRLPLYTFIPIPDREYMLKNGTISVNILPIGNISMTEDKLKSISAKDPKEIGQFVKRFRREAKLTQREAAAMCKVGTRFLSELERGKTSLHLGKTFRVLRAFGIVLHLKRKDLQDG